MRWLVDECVDAALIASLRASEHDVVFVGNIEPAADDLAVLSLALRGKRLLLTDDKDFGELVFRRGGSVPGLVLLRIDQSLRPLRTERLFAAIERFGDDLFGRYTIIEETRFRFRPLLR